MIPDNDSLHPNYHHRDNDFSSPEKSNVEQLAGCILWIIYCFVGYLILCFLAGFLS